MKNWRSLGSLSAASLMMLVACGGKGTTEYQTLLDHLRTSGATVVTTGDSVQLPLSGTEQSIRVNGEEVQIYMYDTAEAANADAAGISQDGQTIKEDKIILRLNLADAPPHFFKKDLLIAFYSGSTSAVITLLESALGPEIAGG